MRNKRLLSDTIDTSSWLPQKALHCCVCQCNKYQSRHNQLFCSRDRRLDDLSQIDRSFSLLTSHKIQDFGTSWRLWKWSHHPPIDVKEWNMVGYGHQRTHAALASRCVSAASWLVARTMARPYWASVRTASVGFSLSCFSFWGVDAIFSLLRRDFR